MMKRGHSPCGATRIPPPPAETIRVNLRSSAHPGPAVNPSPSPGRPVRPPSGLRRAAGVRPAAGCPMTRLAFSATFRDGDLFARGNPVESPGEMGVRLEGASSFHAASRPRRRAFSLRRRLLGRRGSGHGAGWSIRSTDAAATPSSAAPGRSARRAHRRPGASRWRRTAAVVGSSPARETLHRGGILGDSIGSHVHRPLSVRWLGKNGRNIGLPEIGHTVIVMTDWYPLGD